MIPVSIEDLKRVKAVSELPDEHIKWILDRSEVEEFNDGDVITKYGDPAEMMWFLIEGKVTFHMNVGGRQIHFFTFENDDITGGVGGMMPYSRMKIIPGYGYAVGHTKIVKIHKKYFLELEHLNPDFVQRLIGYMTERAKKFATTKLKHEKISALGTLAAGVAHELNNPASAVNRIACELSNRLRLNYELTHDLLKGKITPELVRMIEEIVKKKETDTNGKSRPATIRRMEEEDEMEEWLEKNGLPNRQAAETFAEFGFSTNEFDEISRSVGKDKFINAIPWIENLITSHKLITDLTDASERISSLVNSIKSHVQMDRSGEKEPTNVHDDLENTLKLLGFKLREKNIEVKKKFFSGLPMVQAYVGELNQVWTNIIDNAIHALPKNGKLTIETGFDGINVYVHIIDYGMGIPEEIMSRIFDPFFTTKKIGEGTGIGLDIVNMIVKNHNGEIKVYSEPGRTEFTVCLPVSGNGQPIENH